MEHELIVNNIKAQTYNVKTWSWLQYSIVIATQGHGINANFPWHFTYKFLPFCCTKSKQQNDTAYRKNKEDNESVATGLNWHVMERYMLTMTMPKSVVYQ